MGSSADTTVTAFYYKGFFIYRNMYNFSVFILNICWFPNGITLCAFLPSFFFYKLIGLIAYKQII